MLPLLSTRTPGWVWRWRARSNHTPALIFWWMAASAAGDTGGRGVARNWPDYNASLKRRGSLTIWVDPAMSWNAAPTGNRGRQPDDSDAAIQDLPDDEG